MTSVVSIVRDISVRKRDEEERRRLAAAVEYAADAIMVTDAEWIVQYVNPAFEKVTGYAKEEVLGRNPYILAPDGENIRVYLGIEDKIRSGSPWKGRLKNRRKDGVLIDQDTVVYPIRDPDGKIVNHVVASRDITREVQLEKQAQTAQHMEAVGTLAGGIAHDFNNALTGIIGFADLLRMRLGKEPKLQGDVDEILKCAERASTLTRQLLAFARRQVIEPVVLELNTVVRDISRLMKKVSGEQIEVRTRLTEGIPPIFADRGQLEQVLLNLCLNSRDAMPGGGEFLVSTDAVVWEGERVEDQAVMPAGKYVLLAVADNGSGMDDATRKRAFEPYFTTKAPGKGTGLGLSMVYGIVKQNGGFIFLDTRPGERDDVPDLLPRVGGGLPKRRRRRREAAVKGGAETILLAEDEEAIRNLAERSLRGYGYEVLVARDGAEAVALCEAHPEIAIAVLDVVMPRMGGKRPSTPCAGSGRTSRPCSPAGTPPTGSTSRSSSCPGSSSSRSRTVRPPSPDACGRCWTRYNAPEAGGVMTSKRADGRKSLDIRTIDVSLGVQKHAEGSVLFAMGDTRVVCAATIEERVPPFLRGAGKGWVTAEYSMLPRATNTRVAREGRTGKVGGRTHEIQRLVGRSLRAVVDFEALGERTVTIDCDVLEADGGTRTASINGAWIALWQACRRLGRQGGGSPQPRARPRGGGQRRDRRGAGPGGPRLLRRLRGGSGHERGDDGERPADRGPGDGGAGAVHPGAARRDALGRGGRGEKDPEGAAAFRGRGCAMKLLIASRNRGKVLEIRALLGLALQKVVEVVTLPELPNVEQPREDGKTFAENARMKALHYAKAHRILCIADDSGLAVESLGGSPGCVPPGSPGKGPPTCRTTRICSMSWPRSRARGRRRSSAWRRRRSRTGWSRRRREKWRGRSFPRDGAATASATTRSSTSLPLERRWRRFRRRRRTGSATAARPCGR